METRTFHCEADHSQWVRELLIFYSLNFVESETPRLSEGDTFAFSQSLADRTEAYVNPEEGRVKSHDRPFTPAARQPFAETPRSGHKPRRRIAVKPRDEEVTWTPSTSEDPRRIIEIDRQRAPRSCSRERQRELQKLTRKPRYKSPKRGSKH